MLPCNVIVHEKDNGKIEVATINPLSSMQIVNNDRLKEIAESVSTKLKNVVDNL